MSHKANEPYINPEELHKAFAPRSATTASGETPRTDAAVVHPSGWSGAQYVLADFSRQLERELAAASAVACDDIIGCSQGQPCFKGRETPSSVAPSIPARAAVASSVKFLLERFEKAKCDSDGVSECVRCQVVFLAKSMRELLDAPSTPPSIGATALVPTEASEEMIEAARNTPSRDGVQRFADVWRSMVQSAPQPSTPERDAALAWCDQLLNNLDLEAGERSRLQGIQNFLRSTPPTTAPSGEKSCIHRHDIGFDKWISYQPFVEIGKPNADKEILYTPSQMRAAWEAGATSRVTPSTVAPSMPQDKGTLYARRYEFLRDFLDPEDYYSKWPRWTVAKESGGMGSIYRGEQLDAEIDKELAARSAMGDKAK